MSERDRFDDEANAWQRAFLDAVGGRGPVPPSLSALLRRIDAEAYARAIEEAARACRDVADELFLDNEELSGGDGAMACAEAIRALKTGGSDGE